MAEKFSPEALLQRIVELAVEKKARDIISLNLRGLTLIADYFLIMSVANNRQAQAVCDHICETAKAEGEPCLRVEGYKDAKWVLIDFGAVVIHVFLGEEREYYDLEHLWGDAEAIKY